MKRRRRIFSVAGELLQKSREAALSAIQIFNNPLILFKSEEYIVLMIIAWTYLLHAYYRKRHIEYRYFRVLNGRRKFDKTKGGTFKFWELERCLNDDACPIDRDTCNNLRFLIELRHEIEHQMTMRLDEYLGERYQACAMNFNRYIKQLFGDRHRIDEHLTYSLQFMELSYEQLSRTDGAEIIPPRLQSFIMRFDERLSEAEYNSQSYSYRLYYSRKTANRPGQADRVLDFISSDSEFAQTIEKEHWVKQEVEKPKYRAKDVVMRMQDKGYIRFKMHQHTLLWKGNDAKNPAKGYGVQIATAWYWYEAWLKLVEEHCRANSEQYREP